jgi:hypothetical protein
MAHKRSRATILLAGMPSLLLIGLLAAMALAYNWGAGPDPQLAQAAAADQKPAPGPETIVYTEEDMHHCDVGLDDVHNPPRFENYPAQRSIAQPTRPLLNNRLARAYRTVLRDGVAQGPNFAGNATIVTWGCGSSCHRWAIVDDRTGRVYAPPAEVDMMFGPSNFRDVGLHYQPDSRLLVVVGPTLWADPPGHRAEQWHEGATYLEWTGRSLRMLRAVSVDDLCAEHRGRLVAWRQTEPRHPLNSSL